MRTGGRLGPALVALLAALAATSSHAELSERQLRELSVVEASLKRAVDQAERACLSNYSHEQRRSIFAGMSQLWRQFIGGTVVHTQVQRGADRELSKSLQRVENVDIRKCMDGYIRPALIAYGRVLERITAEDDIDLVDFRFAFERQTSLDPSRFTDHLMLRAITPTRVVERRVSVQNPTGEPYYLQDFRYPPAGKVIKGSIVPELKSVEYSSTPRPITTFCIQRGGPVGANIYHDHFQCREGKNCKPSPHTTRLFGLCPAPPQAQASPRLWRASYQDPPAASRPRWSVPSLQTLTEQGAKGVGYTIFSLESDAFKSDPELMAVEVGLTVNGVAVDEDGLPPEYRPVAARPGESFSHSFGLETLNFEGAANGCEVVEVSLTPVRIGGEKGRPRLARLDYVAFRDVLLRSAADTAAVSWSAAYVRPDREWRNMIFVRSYPYAASDLAARRRAVAKAQADKAWLDGAGYSYEGRPVVGVIRPPRTLQADGSAAYGLIAGLRQPNGTVRFTFSKADAEALGAFLVGKRGGDPRAASVIAPRPFPLATASGIFSLPGVCDG